MPVNTAALKTFAPAMRRQLLEAVGRKLDLLLNSQTPDTLSTYARQIAELREQAAENPEQLLERVAYTWFNRLCALRYLDAKGWHPFGCKVFMPAGEGETQPELLKLMRAGSLPAELKPHTNETRLHGLLDGQIPPAIAGADPQGEVYRELVLASCRSYHQLLPELFEGLDGASELLLPDDLLSEGSIAGGFRSAISDEDCQDVEIIGWLYQFYISEKKDQVIGKVVKSEDIPAATQLFTPNWIVKYMVQNSLGATWLATYPDSPLKGTMAFYIEPAEQTPEVQAQLAAITPESLDPEALTLIDPACGSGHILVEAYDLLKAIYLERGYRQRDIPELILTKNLYGLDICPRAAQLTAFSLLMKGREDDRRLLERGIQLNVMALQNSTGLNVERLAESVELAAADVSRADLRMLVELFAHATTFGSLIEVPTLLVKKLPAMRGLAEQTSQDLLAAGDLQHLRGLVKQAEILSRRYDALAANPPYIGSKHHGSLLRCFVSKNFRICDRDLFAAFILRAMHLTSDCGRSAFVTPFVWLSLGSYESLRRHVFDQYSISSLVQPSITTFFESAIVSLVTYVIDKRSQKLSGTFFNLGRLGSAESQPAKLRAGISEPVCDYRYTATSFGFSEIPGSPVAYWVSQSTRNAYKSRPLLSEIASVRQGLATADDDRFLRLWFEVDLRKHASLNQECPKWFPFTKGGKFRKWYGNDLYVVNWEGGGKEIKSFYGPNGKLKSRPQNENYFFRKGITWTLISMGKSAFRYMPSDSVFGHKGPALLPHREDLLWSLLGFLNSKVCSHFLGISSQAQGFEVGHVSDIPSFHRTTSTDIVSRLVQISREDWESAEYSRNFRRNSLIHQSRSINSKGSVEAAYGVFERDCADRVAEVQKGEFENNRLWIAEYDLKDPIPADVSPEDVSLLANPLYRYSSKLTEEERQNRFRRDTITELLSYAAGCMLGRYSLDQPGLILADSRASQAEHFAAYAEKVGKSLSEVQFKPDPDGIIPVLDGEWFEDDIVARTREFLAVTFPESSVGENLRFIEESLDKDIRKYFCSEFYKDHLQTYKKRPIYWLVQSPKKGFACLIYLHRYTKDTLNQVLNNYFRPYLQKLEARLAQLGLDQLNDDLPTRERTAARKEAEKITKVLKECHAWEQDALLPLAQQRIELDLDDGVKVNYLKLQDVLAPIPGLAAKED